MYNPEKSCKEKDGKRINGNFKKNSFKLYDPELEHNFYTKKSPPTATPGKEKDTNLWVSSRFGASEDDRYTRKILLEEKRKLTILIDSFERPFTSKKAGVANNLSKIQS